MCVYVSVHNYTHIFKVDANGTPFMVPVLQQPPGGGREAVGQIPARRLTPLEGLEWRPKVGSPKNLARIY